MIVLNPVQKLFVDLALSYNKQVYIYTDGHGASYAKEYIAPIIGYRLAFIIKPKKNTHE